MGHSLPRSPRAIMMPPEASTRASIRAAERAAWGSGAQPVVLVTKADLLDEEELAEVRIEWPSLDIRIDAAGRVSLLEALDPALLSGGGGGGYVVVPHAELHEFLASAAQTATFRGFGTLAGARQFAAYLPLRT